ncbi:MAG: sigma-70 family RNA polymerase sigma factor [Acidimicrobiales bacterium]
MEANALVGPLEPKEVASAQVASLEALYRNEYAAMVRLAHLITGSNEVAEDLVQESFVRLHGNWARADNPAVYLRTTVVNRCRSWQRRQVLERRRRPRPQPAAVDAEVRELLDALAQLGARQRAALVLRFYADLPETEIARALGCRCGTVKSLIHRGLRQLEGAIER